MTRVLPLLTLLLASPLAGQGGTDIFLVQLRPSGDRLTVGSVARATDRAGYDNQPHFTPDGSAFLYTSGRDDGQTDIYRYRLSGTNEPVTATPESEYSPTPLPDGSGFSVIRVEADSTQRLWAFDWSGENPRLLLEDVFPVGYQAWVDENHVALFVLGQPATLQVADLRSGRATTMDEAIGRSLHPIPGHGGISYVKMFSDEDRRIRRLDPGNGATRDLVAALGGSQDYAWTPDGSILMGRESTLYRWRPGAPDWEPVADLEPHGVQGITRLAVGPDGGWVAIVGNR